MEEPTRELLHSAVNKRCDKSFESAQYLRKHELICLVRATYLGSFLQDLRLNPIEKINSDVAYCWLYSLGTGSLPPLKTPGKAGVPGLLIYKAIRGKVYSGPGEQEMTRKRLHRKRLPVPKVCKFPLKNLLKLWTVQAQFSGTFGKRFI